MFSTYIAKLLHLKVVLLTIVASIAVQINKRFILSEFLLLGQVGLNWCLWFNLWIQEIFIVLLIFWKCIKKSNEESGYPKIFCNKFLILLVKSFVKYSTFLLWLF